MNGEQCKLWFDDVNELNYTKEKQTDIKYFSDDEIIDDLVKEFVVYEKVEDYVKNIMSIPKAKYEFNKLCQGYQAGYNISLLFNPHRLETSTIKSKSIFEAINTDLNYRKAYARYITKVQDNVVVEKDFYKFIGIGSGGIQYVNEFCPWIKVLIFVLQVHHTLIQKDIVMMKDKVSNAIQIMRCGEIISYM